MLRAGTFSPMNEFIECDKGCRPGLKPAYRNANQICRWNQSEILQ